MLKDKQVNFILSGVFLTLCIPLIIGLVLFLWILDDFNFRDVMFFATGSVAILTFILHTINGERDKKFKQEQMEETKAFNEKNLYNKKCERSYLIISQFYKPEMVESLRAYRELKREVPNLIKNSNVEPFKEHLSKNPKDHSRLHLLLNSFENIAIQIKKEFIDEDIIKDAMHSMFYNIYITLHSYIKDAQSEKGHEKCWEDFVKLCRDWGEPN
ncbi:protein of unknown function [Zunongwangia mangrovi]|uniref:DUF4760 domain-containing protein n=1 Tax=Zunongwangia mangrovi TaxID=1334022 RepID=A0A1I1DAI8_9FLAO|nr:DUF4760 domain-containing protein [Zunongwangia mangrovi]SFB72029.1 protein of unknown function [Zunongwangia mangrovi]